ncbi:hypothetical protein Bca52824_067354 [Brassica carinata]|uniref:Uncharacterized protein n=1 Tax=Brassica carinata TaxID=52824 RepID=A0A8X7QT39_BRACI|nr:hypothetical protein Bca52824_067354 [Brassica carinata]
MDIAHAQVFLVLILHGGNEEKEMVWGVDPNFFFMAATKRKRNTKTLRILALEDGVCSSTSRTSSNEKSSSVSDENQLSTSFERCKTAIIYMEKLSMCTLHSYENQTYTTSENDANVNTRGCATTWNCLTGLSSSLKHSSGDLASNDVGSVTKESLTVPFLSLSKSKTRSVFTSGFGVWRRRQPEVPLSPIISRFVFALSSYVSLSPSCLLLCSWRLAGVVFAREKLRRWFSSARWWSHDTGESFKLPGGAVASGGGSLTRRSVLDCFRFGRRVLWRFVNSRPCLALTRCVGVVVFGTGSVPVVQWRRRRPWPLSRGAVMLLSISLPLPGCSISRNQWSYVDLFHSVLVPVRMCLFWSCHRSILRQRKLTHLRFSEWAIVKALGSFLWSEA